MRLAQDSQAVAVLVSIEDWDTTAKRLADLERVIAGDQASTRNDFVTGDELAEEFAKMGIN